MAVVIFALGIKATNGLVKSTINTANALVKAKIDTSIINIVGKFGGLDYLDAAFPLDERVKKYSLDAIDLNIQNDVTLRNSLFYKEEQQFLTASYTMYHKKVLEEIDKNLTEDDLVIFVHPLAMKIYLKANPNSKVKKIIQVHGNYLEEIDNFELLKEHFEEIDCIQTVSKYMRDDLINILGAPKDKTQYIPNIAIPANIIRKEEKYLKRISIVGSIQKRKNQYDAVRVLELIPDNNVILQIYGHALDKEYTSFIKGYIERKGLTNRVFFKDVASEKEIYENSDLIILTSIHEGFGYSFMEAAMYKIPVVSYDFKYGAKEFLRNNENGCLIEHGNYKQMAKKVNEIFESKELYNQIVQDNSRFFNEEYAEEKTVEKYIALLGDEQTKFSLNDLNKKELPSWIKEEGEHNLIQVGDNINSIKTVISIKGELNHIIIDNNVSMRHCNISLKGNGMFIHIHNNVELTGVVASLFQNTSLSIGKHTTIGNSEITIAEENLIKIGEDCMFAHGQEIRTSDMHPIYSLEDGSRINNGRDIFIGNHVWLGKQCTVLKGTIISDNTVVGINSIVNKKFSEENIVIAGQPANVVKRGIVWGRKMYHKTMFDDTTLLPYIERYKEDLIQKLDNLK